MDDLEDLKNNPLVRDHATLIYTTPSHTKETPRFRIVFVLERTIHDKSEMRAASRSLVLRLSGDPAAVDPARIFYGSRDCKSLISDKGINQTFLDELIKQGRNVDHSVRDDDKKQRGSGRSELGFSRSLVVKTKDASEQPISSLSAKTSIYCPFHLDTNASAFITFNARKQIGIHCSTCASTFWENDADSSVDFFAFDKAAKAIQDHVGFSEDLDTFLHQTETQTHLETANVHFIERPFVEHVNLTEGANFIKSPKASGKTEFLKNIVEDTSGSVLLIGHRRSLINQMCNRLGLHCYLNEPDPGEEQWGSKFHRYGVCLDSISKIPRGMNYDYVFIDESEQVLSHILSSTLDDKRNTAFYRLRNILGTAKHVVALDADLQEVSFNYISEWTRLYDKSRKSRLWINTHKTDQGELYVYDSKPQLIGDLHQSIKEGQRCYVTSNSKGLIEQLNQSIQANSPSSKTIMITSDTVTGEDQFKFLDDPVSHAQNYDVILCSPSVSTGVDITFPDNEKVIDSVYGIFEPFVLTHFECDQQLLRVRHPKVTKVYVTPRVFNFETNFDVVLNDALSLNMMDHVLKDFDINGERPYDKEDPLLQVAASILSMQRASKNRLKKNFLDYKRDQGWKISSVESDEDLQKEGSILALEGKGLVADQMIKSLLDAPKITKEELQELDQKKMDEYTLSPEETSTYVRGLIERFYREDISPELIKLDQKGRYRSAVRSYELLTDWDGLMETTSIRRTMEEVQSERRFLIPNDHQKQVFIAQCLDKSGVYHQGQFKTDQEFTKSDLDEFVSFLQSSKTQYEFVFNNSPNVDLVEKPMRNLNTILKTVGLSMKNMRKTRRGDEAIYYYQIDSKKLEIINGIVNKRNNIRG